MTVSDLKPGVIKECQICKSKKIYEILDLGYSGLCDSLLTIKDLNKLEKSYPLKLLRCKNRRYYLKRESKFLYAS